MSTQTISSLYPQAVGNVVGPASAVANNLAVFNGVTGKIIKDSGASVASFDPAGSSGAVQGNLNSHAGLSTTAHGGIVASTDPRLTDARTPIGTTLVFGKIFRGSGANVVEAVDGSTIFLPVGLKGAANGVAELGADTKHIPAQIPFGTGANTVCQGNDGRLSDSRTPLSHAASHAIGVADTVFPTGSALQVLRRNAGNTSLEFATLMESEASWQQQIRDKVESLVGIVATDFLTTSGAGDLQTAINALDDGDVLEIQTNATYTPITLPTAKAITIMAGAGYLPKITGQYGITLVDGCRDIIVAGIILQNCTTGSVNDKGAAICLAHQAKVQDITFYDCTIKLVAAGSGVMLSYHQSLGGDFYYTASTLAEMSERVAFVSCCFNRCGPDGGEGACLAARGIKQFMAEDCTVDAANDGRGIQLQNCIDAWIARNVVINCRDTVSGNGEAIKFDSIGTPSGYRISGAIVENKIRNAIEGIDIDDVTSMSAIYGNVVSDCLDEGISLDGGTAPLVGYAGIVGNICFRCANGIRLESGSVAELSGNVCFGNTTNNYLIENGYSLDATNTTSPSDAPQAGDEFGPASATGDNFVAFNGTTGRLMKDSGKSTADFYMAATYTGNDIPGAGSNMLTSGYSRIWNRVSDGKSFLVTNAGGTYRLVELTDYA